MTSQVLTETPHAGEFLLSEASGHQSRDVGVIDSSQTLVAGHVLGRITQGGQTAVSAAFAGNTGNGVLGTLTGDAGIPAGVYKVELTLAQANAGRFHVYMPDGTLDGEGTVGVAYNGAVNFTLADGATDFVAGDGFNITIAYPTTSNRYVEFDPAGTDGRQIPAGILFRAATTAAGETAQRTIIKRLAEVMSARLTWKAGVTTNQKAAALAQLLALNGDVGLIVARS